MNVGGVGPFHLTQDVAGIEEHFPLVRLELIPVMPEPVVQLFQIPRRDRPDSRIGARVIWLSSPNVEFQIRD